jgi:micrococcal nuclease
VRRLTALLLAAITLLGACRGAGSEAGPSTTSAPAATTTPGSEPTAQGSPATSLAVLDGDTFLVVVDGAEEEVRLLGVNAPERDECFSSRSRRLAESLVGTGPLVLDVAAGRDRYGRLLAYVHSGDVLVNQDLLEQGGALAIDTGHPRLADFLEAEDRAVVARIGMWARDACGPAPPETVTVAEVEADPPGRDEERLEEEYVALANEGPDAVDLSDWTLRDESSTHRYRFPSGATIPPGERLVIRTGCGADGDGVRYWCRGEPVWNNGGDTVLLLDPPGNVAARRRYSG